MNLRLMKSHKRFLVWTKVNEQTQTWLLAGETNDWSRASSLALSYLKKRRGVDVMINEFIPLKFTDSREISFHNQSITNVGESQPPTGVFLDKSSGKVLVDGRLKILSFLEYALLSLLYERENEIVPKSAITLHVWHEEYLPHPKMDLRIEQLISRLRRKIEPDPRNPKYILNIRQRGYILNCTGEYQNYNIEQD